MFHSSPLRICAALALSLFAVSALAAPDDGSAPVPTASVAVSVYDGDTFTLSTGDKVRVSGVNTPELRPLEPFGIEGRDVTAAFVADRQVELEYGSVKRDTYGRLLAYVRVGGVPLEEHLLEKGVAHVFLIPPIEVADVDAMLKVQQKAKEDGVGLWSTEGFQGAFHFTSFHANGKGIDERFVNGEYLRICNITDKTVDMENYVITNIAGDRFTFPKIEVPAGHTVKVHSGRGQHQLDASRQLEVYLASATPIWHNGYDKATLYDARGQEVDRREHKVKKPTR